MEGHLCGPLFLYSTCYVLFHVLVNRIFHMGCFRKHLCRIRFGADAENCKYIITLIDQFLIPVINCIVYLNDTFAIISTFGSIVNGMIRKLSAIIVTGTSPSNRLSWNLFKAKSRSLSLNIRNCFL